MLTYHFLRGNVVGVAKYLIKMSITPDANPADYERIISEEFAKHKIKNMNLKEFYANVINDKSEIRRHNDHLGIKGQEIENYGKAIMEIYTRCGNELGFRPTPRYTQVLRSMAPSLGLLWKLQHHIPLWSKISISTTQVLAAVPMGFLKLNAARFPMALGELSTRVDGYIQYIFSDLNLTPWKAIPTKAEMTARALQRLEGEEEKAADAASTYLSCVALFN